MLIRIALLGAALAALAPAQSTVIVRPKMIDDVLVNPNMGIQTFQHYARQPLFAGTRWSEVGPERCV